MSCRSDETEDGAIVVDDWSIICGVDFCETFILRDPTQPKIANPDFDETLPVDECNQPEVYPLLDLSGYAGCMDIRNGTDRGSTLIHSIKSGGGGMTFNDPTTGMVKLFIDRSLTGAERASEDDPKAICDYAGGCAHFDLILDPQVPGEPNFRLFLGDIPIEEPRTNVQP